MKSAISLLKTATDYVSEVKKLAPLLDNEVRVFERKKEQTEVSVTSIISEWQQLSKQIKKRFNKELLVNDLKTPEDIHAYIVSLRSIVKSIEPGLLNEIKESLSAAGIEVAPNFKLDSIDESARKAITRNISERGSITEEQGLDKLQY